MSYRIFRRNATVCEKMQHFLSNVVKKCNIPNKGEKWQMQHIWEKSGKKKMQHVGGNWKCNVFPKNAALLWKMQVCEKRRKSHKSDNGFRKCATYLKKNQHISEKVHRMWSKCNIFAKLEKTWEPRKDMWTARANIFQSELRDLYVLWN